MKRRADWERGSGCGLACDQTLRKQVVLCMQTCRSQSPSGTMNLKHVPFLPIIDVLLLQARVYGRGVVALHVDVHGCVLADEGRAVGLPEVHLCRNGRDETNAEAQATSTTC